MNCWHKLPVKQKVSLSAQETLAASAADPVVTPRLCSDLQLPR